MSDVTSNQIVLGMISELRESMESKLEKFSDNMETKLGKLSDEIKDLNEKKIRPLEDFKLKSSLYAMIIAGAVACSFEVLIRFVLKV